MTAQMILENAARLGVTIEREGDDLRLKPSENITPELRATVKAHKGELVAYLNPSAPGTPSKPETSEKVFRGLYGQREQKVFSKAGVDPENFPLCAVLKANFPDAKLLSLRSEVESVRLQAARIIRKARKYDSLKAIILRDAWRERVSICVIDGGMTEAEAELVALDELMLIDTKQIS